MLTFCRNSPGSREFNARYEGQSYVTEPQETVLPDLKDRPPTILVVDDDVLIRMTLSDFLQECGFKVLEAGNGDEAITMIESNAATIDLVFTDVRMRGNTDGFALARWIREHRKDLAVIMASGDAKKSDAAQQLCADEPFLTKPYDLHFAVAQIRQRLALASKG